MNETIKLADVQIGDNFTRTLLIKAINTEVASNGKPYIKITITDGETQQSVVVFDTTVEALAAEGIMPDVMADVNLQVENYKGSKSFKIVSIHPTTDPTVNIMDYIKMPPMDIDMMYTEIIGAIRASADSLNGKYEPLAQLAEAIIENNKEGYIKSSAAVSMHHAIRGELLYHTYRMVKSAIAICDVYSILDKELLICGAALHDIGKLWEYKTSESGNAEFTPDGALLGHLYIGASLIKGYTAKHNYSPEKVELLVHLLLSHHGQREWGAVQLPAVPEAIVLHHIDDIDAKMYMCEENYEQLDPGKMTSKKVFGLDTNLYKAKYRG